MFCFIHEKFKLKNLLMLKIDLLVMGGCTCLSWKAGNSGKPGTSDEE
jgi:hypothetical protein